MSLASQDDPSPTPSGTRLAVLGAGAWGSVIASLLGRNGHEVRLWSRRPEHARSVEATRRNDAYLPELALPPTVRATSDIGQATEGAEAVFLVVPSRALREVLPHLDPAGAYVSCIKGLERGTLHRPSEVVRELLPAARVAALSGPNLAGEIARGLPAAAVAASDDATLARSVQAWLGCEAFRVYTSSDVAGVEIGGAMKNVIALASGMCDGLELGENARASILTRGLAEIARLGVRWGGRPQTFYGLSGLGDLAATCTSPASRNHQAGFRLARGETLEDLESSGMTTEGIPTVRAVREYAREHDLDAPIANEVFRVVFEGKSPRVAIRDLMLREAKPE